MESVARIVVTPSATRLHWEDRKRWLSAEFRAYMDTEILPTPPRPGVTIPGSV